MARLALPHFQPLSSATSLLPARPAVLCPVGSMAGDPSDSAHGQLASLCLPDGMEARYLPQLAPWGLARQGDPLRAHPPVCSKHHCP